MTDSLFFISEFCLNPSLLFESSDDARTTATSESTEGEGLQVLGEKVMLLWLMPQTDIFYLTNRKWFSVVCTLIANDIRHHSGQNVVDSRGKNIAE